MISPEALDAWFQENETFGQYLGVHCSKTDIGYCELEAVVMPPHLNNAKTAHGGFLFTLIDLAAGIAGSFTEAGRRQLVTQNASIYYLKSAMEGERLRAEGRLVHSGHTMGIVFAKIRNENDEVLARGEVSVFYMSSAVADDELERGTCLPPEDRTT